MSHQHKVKSSQKAGDRLMAFKLRAGNSALEKDRRERQRFGISAYVTLTIRGDSIPAYTRDLSSQGLYLYVGSTDGFQIGQSLELLVKLPPDITLSSHCLIRCRGRLVRMEDAPGDLTGIAVKILQYSILNDAQNGI
jgi:hypothetical protein